MNKRILTKISEQFTILPKSKIKAGQALDSGKYPFYTSSDTKVSYLDTYEYDDEIVILGTGGKPSCNYAKGKFSFSTDNFALKTKGNVKPKYLYYFLRNNNLSILEKGFLGSGLKHIGKEYMLNILFPLEDIEKQDKIIKTLDSITQAKQNAIDRFFQLNEFIKSRFIEMFGDPLINDKKWETGKLVSLCPIKQYKGYIQKFNNNVWLLNLDVIEANTGRVIEKVLVPEKSVGSSTVTFSSENILYSKLRPYLNKIVIPDTSGYATSELIPLLPCNKINKIFLAYLLRGDSFVDFMNSKSGGAKMPRASMDALKKFDLIIPPIELQNSFAKFVKQVDKSKFIVQKQIDDLQELLDSKMDEYFG